MKTESYSFYEFFAGGGMARAGLGKGWRCLFANDFDHKKSTVYRSNWDGGSELLTQDIGTVGLADLPSESPDLVWASFPCQDLSLAGGGAGLKGDRSGTFWPFWKLMKSLHGVKRAPRVIVLENVLGTLTSHEGKDFQAIINALIDLDYDVGAVVADAELFVPQSRPRLFVIGVPRDTGRATSSSLPSTSIWHTPALLKAHGRLPNELKKRWIWWDMPAPPMRTKTLVDIIEDEPTGVTWHTAEETTKLIGLMAPLHKQRVEKAKASDKRTVGTVYRRMRPGVDGTIQRAEVRFDDVAGCLRTPAGGSSRQLLLVIEKGKVRSRLISSRETARLMGLKDTYQLPERYNEAYHLTGDGVVVPVVRHLAKHIIEPQLQQKTGRRAA